MILNCTATEGTDPVLLLHGMTASLRYWEDITPVIDSSRHRIIAVDLLGFGRSAKPKNITYDYDAHIASILETLDDIGIHKPATIIAHSMGALIALRLAVKYPERVKHLVLIGLPYYPSPETARKEITQGKRIVELTYYGPTSHALCTVWCRLLRPVTKYIAPLYLKRLPKVVAEDSLLHTWQSYMESMHNVIESQSVPDDLQHLAVPATLLYGSEDTALKYVHNDGIAKGLPNVRLQVVADATHNLPLEVPGKIAELL